MELGNMIFGNSRGEFPVPRTPDFEEPWEAFTEALKIGWRGGPDEGCLVPEAKDFWGVENDTFRIRTYDWNAECDCGADDKMEEWFDKHPHGDDCYQAELRARLKSWEDRSGYTQADAAAFGRNDNGPFPGMDVAVESPQPGVTVMVGSPRRDAAMEVWRKLSDRRDKVQRALYKELAAKHGVDPHYGAAVHCTCGRDARGNLFWQNIGGHADTCRFVQPNFLFKPSGFRMNWYKYPFRDAYMSEELSPDQWAEMLQACIASAAPEGATGNMRSDAELGPGMNPNPPSPPPGDPQ